MTLMLSINDDVCTTDEKLLYVAQWTAAYGKDLPSLFLAPDFMLSPQVNNWYDADDIALLGERCRYLFGHERIVLVTEYCGPPKPGTHTILLVHADWQICEKNLAPHFLVLNISRGDKPETLLRQLILLRLAYTIYKGDRAKLAWLFKSIKPSVLAPIKRLSDDEEFDYIVHRVLLDSVEHDYWRDEHTHDLYQHLKHYEDPDFPF